MSKTIFVVDDDPDMVKVASFRLAKGGFTVKTFTLGAEALKAIGESPPDLVVLDVQMPDMTGHDVAQSIESQENTKNVPVIFLTGKVDFDPAIEEKSHRAMFVKPCDFDKLIQKINEMTS